MRRCDCLVGQPPDTLPPHQHSRLHQRSSSKHALHNLQDTARTRTHALTRAHTHAAHTHAHTRTHIQSPPSSSSRRKPTRSSRSCVTFSKRTRSRAASSIPTSRPWSNWHLNTRTRAYTNDAPAHDPFGATVQIEKLTAYVHGHLRGTPDIPLVHRVFKVVYILAKATAPTPLRSPPRVSLSIGREPPTINITIIIKTHTHTHMRADTGPRVQDCHPLLPSRGDAHLTQGRAQTRHVQTNARATRWRTWSQP